VSPPPVVAFRSVGKRFGQISALDDVSFDVAPGECVALLGPSGCGKTTTLRILAGFETPDRGAIAIGGRDMRGVPTFERPIGLVFQDYALFPHMSVAENVDYGLKRRGVPRAERAERRAEVLRLVRLTGLEERRPAELSGGQQQRVALARALAPRPALLLLDEPLSNLDARLRQDLRQELRAILQSAGTTTLMVTHDQEEALAMADRVVLMNGGCIEQIGAPDAIYAKPATRFAARFLGRCNWLDGRWESAGGVFVAECGMVARVAEPPPGDPARVALAIRPERIRLASGTWEGQPNRYAGTVAARRFLGPDLALELIVDGHRLEASLKADGRRVPSEGEVVSVEIDPEACVVLPAEAAQ
jgi:ABC-type Fe3+/spermidine/putrescine transport system ATPase subunit